QRRTGNVGLDLVDPQLRRTHGLLRAGAARAAARFLKVEFRLNDSVFLLRDAELMVVKALRGLRIRYFGAAQAGTSVFQRLQCAIDYGSGLVRTAAGVVVGPLGVFEVTPRFVQLQAGSSHTGPGTLRFRVFQTQPGIRQRDFGIHDRLRFTFRAAFEVRQRRFQFELGRLK